MVVRFNPERLARLKTRMEWHVGEGNSPGIAWQIGSLSDIVDEGAVGDVPERALWRIYSMTKPLVSVAAMQLFEECRVPLHAPIARWLPEFKAPVVLNSDGSREPAKTPITVRHLLCHMAGFTYGFQGDGVARMYAQAGVLTDEAASLRAQSELIASMPLVFHPGTGWRYSVATDILAALLEVEEDRPIRDILQRRVFDPLGMTETGFHVRERDLTRIMKVHGSPLPPALPPIPPLSIETLYPSDNPEYGRGGHGLFATLSDYTAFAKALLALATAQGDGPVSPRGLQAMITNQVPDAQLPLSIDLPFDTVSPGLGGFGFGLGFAVDQGASGSNLLGHPGCFGWSGAADTWFTVDPDGGFYAVFMAQDLDPGGTPADFQTLLHAAVC
ncbi:MAG: serine hydrolase domain-containing protein [Arenibacterium sp.]